MAVRISAKKITEYGLYLFVFLLPVQARWIIRAGAIDNGYWEYGTISLYATDILLLALLALFVIFKFRDSNSKPRINSEFQIPAYWWIIAGLELTVFISIFSAPDKLLAVYKYGWFFSGVGLFWLITEADYNFLKLFYAFLSGAALSAGLGIYQFLFQASFACKWLGLAAHNSADLGVSVVETLSGGRWLRAYGGLDHPNMLGGLMAIGILLVIGMLPSFRQPVANPAGTGGRRLNFVCRNLRFVCFRFAIFCLFIFIAALFFTFSRGAWGGLIAGLLVILGLALTKKDMEIQKKVLKIILTGGVLIFILFNIYGDLALTRLSKDTRLEIKSRVERTESLKMAENIIKNNWLFGVGIGNYTEELAIGNRNLKNNMPAWHYQPVHNVFLLVWAEIGIFGLIFFLALLCFVCYSAARGWGARGNKIYKIGLITALGVMFMVDHWFWSLHFGVLLFWLILGIIYKENKNFINNNFANNK